MIELERKDKIVRLQKALSDFSLMFNFFVEAMNNVEGDAKELGISEEQMWAIQRKADNIVEETVALKALVLYRTPEAVNG